MKIPKGKLLDLERSTETKIVLKKDKGIKPEDCKDDVWYWVETYNGYKEIHLGNPLKDNISYSLQGELFNGATTDEAEDIKYIRPATPEEIALVRKAKPEWFEPVWSRQAVITDALKDLGISFFENNDIHRKHLLMYMMDNWARHHNKIDNWVADWGNNRQRKWGIVCRDNKYGANCCSHLNIFPFGISVSNKERAEQMLAEFSDDLNKVKW